MNVHEKLLQVQQMELIYQELRTKRRSGRKGMI